MTVEKKSFLTITTAVAVVMVLMLALIPAEALAESEDVSQISEFKSYSAAGCTDDATIYNTDPSINLDAGWGKIELGDWSTMTCDFYIYFVAGSATDELVLTIADEDDTGGNYIEIRINSYSTSTTKVTVEDNFNGESWKDSDTDTIDTTATWQLVTVKITETTSSTDGTKTIIDIDIGSADFDNCDFELFSSEISTDVKQRKWNDFTFESEADTSEVKVDGIDIDTSGAAIYGYNYTILLVLGFGGYLCLAAWRRWWPLNGKVTNPTQHGPKRKLG